MKIAQIAPLYESFDEMSIDEKLDILLGCFGSEIRALTQLQSPSTPLTAGATPRLN
jgi:hypothetical protein